MKDPASAPADEAARRPTTDDARSCTRRGRATGTRPGRSPHRSPGGALSPRSGRRSPIRVLPGGQAAKFHISSSRATAALPPGRFLIASGARPRREHAPAPNHPEPQPTRPTLSEEGPAGGARSLTNARTRDRERHGSALRPGGWKARSQRGPSSHKATRGGVPERSAGPRSAVLDDQREIEPRSAAPRKIR